MKKRTWHYAYAPALYSVYCDKCTSPNTWWSEYEHMIWCYDCKIDTKGTKGVFGGPIGVEITKLLIGPYAFHRYFPDTGIWMNQREIKGKIVYIRCKAPLLKSIK